MKYLSIAVLAALALPAAAAAQKGIDTQTQQIKREANKTTARGNDATRSFDWGKGKTPDREPLANPYRLGARRDVLIESIKSVLKDQKILVDEAASRPSDGIIVTQPFVFAKGPVTTPSELSRYGLLQDGDAAWSRGQYTLTIEVQSIDGVQNNVSVNARIEGRAGAGLTTEWVTIPSSGLAEDNFLVKLVANVTGRSPDDAVETDSKD